MLMRKANSGFSLVELLVALIVLSIGFAGYAALQLVGVRSVEDSYQRSQMTMLVEEMAERMRANRGAFGLITAGTSEYHGFDYLEGDDLCATNAGLGDTVINALRCEEDNGLAAQNCNAQQMARYDVARVYCGYEFADNQWSGGVIEVSEGARLQVSCNVLAPPAPLACPTGTPHTITGTWQTAETDRNDAEDQDGDGNTLTMTQTVSIVVTP